jgi:hypothetical protein
MEAGRIPKQLMGYTLRGTGSIGLWKDQPVIEAWNGTEGTSIDIGECLFAQMSQLKFYISNASFYNILFGCVLMHLVSYFFPVLFDVFMFIYVAG